MTTRGLMYPGQETLLQFIIINQFIQPSPLSVHRWEVWAPRRDRVHPQRGRPRVRERDRRGRRGSTKAADRPDQTSRRRSQSLQLESPSFPTPARPCDRPFKKNLQHTCPSLLSVHSQRASVPLISVQLQAKINLKKKTHTNKHCSKTVFVGERGDGMRRLVDGDGWESHTHSSHSADRRRGEWRGRGRSPPPSQSTLVFSKEGGDICPDVVGTCHLPHIHPLLVLHCSSLAVPLPLASQLLVWSQRHF